jgi:hypothetical protein
MPVDEGVRRLVEQEGQDVVGGRLVQMKGDEPEARVEPRKKGLARKAAGAEAVEGRLVEEDQHLELELLGLQGNALANQGPE